MISKNLYNIGVAATLLAAATSVQAANSFDDAIKNATNSGQFRLAYISFAPDTTGTDTTTTAAAVGGYIKFETAEWNKLQFAIAPYFSEKVDALSGDQTQGKLNGDFFDSNGDSYAYLGEAYVNYMFNNGSARYGRQQLDNPFINTDDIRMHPNTFSAFWLNMSLAERLSLEAGRVSQWAGFDSGDSQDKFKTSGVDGVIALGLSYKMKEHHSFQGWYYDFADLYSQLYLDTAYENGNFSAGLQYSSYSEENTSGTDGSVWGASVSYALDAFTFGLVVNESSNDAGKSNNLGLGGGNFYATMDEMTLGDLTDASAQVFSVEYAATENFSATLAVGKFEDASIDIDETNLVLGYSVSDMLDVEFVHAVVDNNKDATDTDTNFSRSLVRVNYNF